MFPLQLMELVPSVTSGPVSRLLRLTVRLGPVVAGLFHAIWSTPPVSSTVSAPQLLVKKYRSSPRLPSILSLPLSPNILSLPAPPSCWSLPAPPPIPSLPAPPVILLLEGLPVSVSAKAVPTTFSMKAPATERQPFAVEGQSVVPCPFRLLVMPLPPVKVAVSVLKFSVSTPALSAEMRSAPQLLANL